jgi:hypothetical protein
LDEKGGVKEGAKKRFFCNFSRARKKCLIIKSAAGVKWKKEFGGGEKLGHLEKTGCFTLNR